MSSENKVNFSGNNKQDTDSSSYDLCTAISVVLQGINIAQKKGAYSLDDAGKLYNASIVLQKVMEQIKRDAEQNNNISKEI